MQVRAFVRVYTVGHDDLRAGRGPGWFWAKHDDGGREYHGRSLVLWVNKSARGDRRFEWECGRLAVSF